MTSTHLLPWYWNSCFPYDVYAKWLPWDRQVVAVTDPETCVFSRHVMSSAAAFEQLLRAKAPSKADLGAYGLNETLRPLVLDIDITSYADASDCIDDSCVRVICEGCWKRFMVPAMAILDAALREDFGLTRILWIFSGKKGVQCVVWDEVVLGLDAQGRTDIVNYLSADPTQMFLGGPIHPRNTEPGPVKRAIDIMKRFESVRPVYPRLDRAVTTQVRHLLKMCYSPHPTSGYIALPILPVDAPRPLLTLAKLEELANQGRLDDPRGVWARHLRLFRDAVSEGDARPSVKRKRHSSS